MNWQLGSSARLVAPELQSNAISFATDNTVRAILTALCDDEDVRTKAYKFLGMLEPEAIVAAKNNGVARKRKATLIWSICVQCERPFNEEAKQEKTCHYHNGELELDEESSIWADHDVGTHGDPDCDHYRKECPEGFFWSCCEKNNLEPGCKLGYHQSDPAKNKRHKDDDTEPEGGEDEEEGDTEEDDEDADD
ncbi:hypothetical protein B0T25DRAFT_267100 [Lasiosphaeria hispida]|uniref:C2H2-type domain-containing protein n=1 Tax=Lasiosphaeria hispida TaxID=260671 RepID=A0AAJ0MAB9_9PEZI|nr:hypothetical protein B0T25DRAFT_267100 [Lasiosphaeria hispida]